MKQSTKKGGTKGKGRGSKGEQLEAKAEAFKAEAVTYARQAYDAALAHFEATNGKPGVPVFYVPLEAGAHEIETYHSTGRYFAHILSSDKCPKQFRDLFAAAFNDLLGRVSRKLAWPGALPLTYAIVRDLCDASTCTGEAEGVRDTLMLAAELMAPPALLAEAERVGGVSK